MYIPHKHRYHKKDAPDVPFTILAISLLDSQARAGAVLFNIEVTELSNLPPEDHCASQEKRRAGQKSLILDRSSAVQARFFLLLLRIPSELGLLVSVYFSILRRNIETRCGFETVSKVGLHSHGLGI